jgi:hypothetical protein
MKIRREGKYRKAAKLLVEQVDMCDIRESRCRCVKFAETLLKNLVSDISKRVVR